MQAFRGQDNTNGTDQLALSALRCDLLECSRFTLIRLNVKSNQRNSADIGSLKEIRVSKYLRIEVPPMRTNFATNLLLPSSFEEFHLHSESSWRDWNERIELDKITKEIFSFVVLLLASDDIRHSKLKTMMMRRNQSTEDVELAVMAVNHRLDF